MSLTDKVLASNLVKPAITYWNQLAQRDRIALKVLSMFFAAFAMYSLVVSPVLRYKDAQQAYYQSRLEFLKEVKEYEPRLKQVSGNNKSTGRVSTSLINRIAKQQRLEIKQISPDREGKIRATFENTNAVAILSLIQELSQKHNVHVVQGSIDRRSPGKVNAKLLFGS
jgi:general secretion pathway protein M